MDPTFCIKKIAADAFLAPSAKSCVKPADIKKIYDIHSRGGTLFLFPGPHSLSHHVLLPLLDKPQTHFSPLKVQRIKISSQKSLKHTRKNCRSSKFPVLFYPQIKISKNSIFLTCNSITPNAISTNHPQPTCLKVELLIFLSFFSLTLLQWQFYQQILISSADSSTPKTHILQSSLIQYHFTLLDPPLLSTTTTGEKERGRDPGESHQKLRLSGKAFQDPLL